MPAGSLLAAYAYHVYPEQIVEPIGGVVSPAAELAAALDSTFDRSRVDSAPVVNLRVDTSGTSRSHPVRDIARAVAFSDEPQAGEVETLAKRLASAMDNRSKASLLMVSVHESPSSGSRRFIIWTFPQQEVFNLSTAGGETRLELVDAFIRESSLRKVALLEGKMTSNGMLTARVLDYQSTGIQRPAADLWIDKFLDAQLQMNSTEGTKILARAFREAYRRTAGDQTAQDQLGAAIASARLKRQQRTSVDDVASKHLGPVAASALKAGLGPDARAAIFELDVDEFDEVLQYRRFTLKSGVIVSAPFVEIGTDGDVQVITQADGGRRIKAEGAVAQEELRTRG